MIGNYILHKIASKADYISDVARNAAYQGGNIDIIDYVRLNEVFQQLQSIADIVDEYHDWGDE